MHSALIHRQFNALNLLARIAHVTPVVRDRRLLQESRKNLRRLDDIGLQEAVHDHADAEAYALGQGRDAIGGTHRHQVQVLRLRDRLAHPL